MEFPVMLYRANGSMLEWDGEQFDYVIAADADDIAAAEADGFSIAKPTASEDAPRRGRPRKQVDA